MLALFVVVFVAFFAVHESLSGRQSVRNTMAMSTQKKWPGDRPPIANPQLLKQKMDASWGRGKFR